MMAQRLDGATVGVVMYNPLIITEGLQSYTGTAAHELVHLFLQKDLSSPQRTAWNRLVARHQEFAKELADSSKRLVLKFEAGDLEDLETLGVLPDDAPTRSVRAMLGEGDMATMSAVAEDQAMLAENDLLEIAESYREIKLSMQEDIFIAALPFIGLIHSLRDKGIKMNLPINSMMGNAGFLGLLVPQTLVALNDEIFVPHRYYIEEDSDTGETFLLQLRGISYLGDYLFPGLPLFVGEFDGSTYTGRNGGITSNHIALLNSSKTLVTNDVNRILGRPGMAPQTFIQRMNQGQDSLTPISRNDLVDLRRLISLQEEIAHLKDNRYCQAMNPDYFSTNLIDRADLIVDTLAKNKERFLLEGDIAAELQPGLMEYSAKLQKTIDLMTLFIEKRELDKAELVFLLFWDEIMQYGDRYGYDQFFPFEEGLREFFDESKSTIFAKYFDYKMRQQVSEGHLDEGTEAQRQDILVGMADALQEIYKRDFYTDDERKENIVQQGRPESFTIPHGIQRDLLGELPGEYDVIVKFNRDQGLMRDQSMLAGRDSEQPVSMERRRLLIGSLGAALGLMGIPSADADPYQSRLRSRSSFIPSERINQMIQAIADADYEDMAPRLADKNNLIEFFAAINQLYGLTRGLYDAMFDKDEGSVTTLDSFTHLFRNSSPRDSYETVREYARHYQKMRDLFELTDEEVSSVYSILSNYQPEALGGRNVILTAAQSNFIVSSFAKLILISDLSREDKAAQLASYPVTYSEFELRLQEIPFSEEKRELKDKIVWAVSSHPLLRRQQHPLLICREAVKFTKELLKGEGEAENRYFGLVMDMGFTDSEFQHIVYLFNEKRDGRVYWGFMGFNPDFHYSLPQYTSLEELMRQEFPESSVAGVVDLDGADRRMYRESVVPVDQIDRSFQAMNENGRPATQPEGFSILSWGKPLLAAGGLAAVLYGLRKRAERVRQKESPGNTEAVHSDQSLLGATADATASEDETNLGGIDLDPGLLDLQRQGQGIDFGLFAVPENAGDVKVDGYIPVIFKIIPVDSLFLSESESNILTRGPKKI